MDRMNRTKHLNQITERGELFLNVGYQYRTTILPYVLVLVPILVPVLVRLKGTHTPHTTPKNRWDHSHTGSRQMQGMRQLTIITVGYCQYEYDYRTNRRY